MSQITTDEERLVKKGMQVVKRILLEKQADDILAHTKTTAERQARRRTALNTYARVQGFASWSALETAVLNGRAHVAK